MDELQAIKDWLLEGYFALLTILQDRHFPAAIGFFGVLFAFAFVGIAVVGFMATRKAKHDRFKRQGNKEERTFIGSKVVLKGSEDAERFIALTGNLRGFSEGEIARLKVKFIGFDPAKEFTTVIVKNRRASYSEKARFDPSNIQISLSAFNEFGVGMDDIEGDITIDKLIGHVTLVPGGHPKTPTCGHFKNTHLKP